MRRSCGKDDVSISREYAVFRGRFHYHCKVRLPTRSAQCLFTTIFLLTSNSTIYTLLKLFLTICCCCSSKKPDYMTIYTNTTPSSDEMLHSGIPQGSELFARKNQTHVILCMQTISMYGSIGCVLKLPERPCHLVAKHKLLQ